MIKFRPMLAATIEDTAAIPYTVRVSAKLDGVRCLVIDGVAMSRSLKPFRNRHVQALFGRHDLNGYDGELICGEPTDHDVYRKTSSGCMSEDGEPSVRFFVFDRWDMPTEPFVHRYDALRADHDGVVKVEQRIANNEAELLAIEQELIEQGYEGVMARVHNAPYKFGRSTLREFALAKLKRMASSEAEIIELIELERNTNEATTNELGYTERSTHKANKVGGDTLGALRVRCIETGVEFNIGTGFDAATRDEIWANRGEMIGKLVTYNHFPVGRKDLPRHPSFKGFRDPSDL